MLPALVLAAACVPDLVGFTPTPTVERDQVHPEGNADYQQTVGYRVYWKRPEDAAWHGSVDLPAFHGNEDDAPIYPGITIPFPVQRAYPDDVQGEEVTIAIKAFSHQNVESAPSGILTFCAPRLCTPPGPCD